MKIAYHNPYPTTINAYRTISKWFERAFIELWHDFKYFTPDDKFTDFFNSFKPDIFITCTHFVYQKYIDYNQLLELRKKWLIVFTKLDFWDLPKNINQLRISEAKVMKNDLELINKIKNWLISDIFFHVVEQWDERMNWFTERTWYKYHTIPLAVDKTLINTEVKKDFKADISFIGTNSPDKQEIFTERLFPLKNKYHVKLYWQDWSQWDKILWWIQRLWQYFNIPYLKSIRKPKLKLEDEWNIYKSSKICINLHEKNQLLCWWDCNERTFKIPAYWWFQIVDNIECIKTYFKEGEEIIIAKDSKDWFEKIEYYMNHIDEREKIIAAWKAKVLNNHTYHNRVEQIINIYNESKWIS